MTITQEHIGEVVQYEVGGVAVFWGILETVKDGWAGIRQPQDGNRIDEAPAHLVHIDPT
jgi:hypothetical protein